MNTMMALLLAGSIACFGVALVFMAEGEALAKCQETHSFEVCHYTLR